MNAEPKPLVLIVDDNPQNLRVAVGVLEEVGYECAMAVSGEEVVAFAESDRPDLILLDIMIPGMDGYEICSRLKQHPATGDIPVIFLTARSDAQDVVKGFAVGAVDYVTKPFNRPELTARVAAHVELKRSRDGLKRYVSEMEAVNTELRAAYDTITQKSRQLEAAMEELELVSRTDVVTNLANRRFMQARLSEEMARYSRSGLPFSIILVDADHFKSINDTY
ncbi:MAG TPA: response regulator, partial [Symbiobacteriaceae bacterium]|nr:response regulator [Symbiobacteriaceae bacterium]